MTPKQVFVREATGLIREFGGLDTFLINMAIINMAGGMVFDIFLIFFFPGASLPLMFFLGGIPTIGIFIVYTILSVAMPRTGGDYVYASRILHPALGFAGGIMNVFGFFVFMVSGFFCWWIITTPTPAFFLAMGLSTGDPSYTAIANFLSTNVNFDFILSTGLVILAGLIVALGSRVFRWTYRFVYVYYFVGALALLIGLFATNHETFVASLESIAGQGAYQKILSDAGSYGVYSFSWFQTLLAMVPLGFLTLSGFQVSTYLGGEVKNAKSTQTLGMGASMLLTWIYLVVASYQTAAVFGNDFLGGFLPLGDEPIALANTCSAADHFVIVIGIPKRSLHRSNMLTSGRRHISDNSSLYSRSKSHRLRSIIRQSPSGSNVKGQRTTALASELSCGYGCSGRSLGCPSILHGAYCRISDSADGRARCLGNYCTCSNGLSVH